MRMYSSRQVAVISVLVALLTVAALATFRLSPYYRPVRDVRKSWIRLLHKTDELTESEKKAIHSSYEHIAEKRESVVDKATLDHMDTVFHQLDIWAHLYWLGVPFMKNPLDAWMMQQIIAEVRPDYVVEAGTWRGGAALYFASVLNGLGLTEAKVITIDIEDKRAAEAVDHPLWPKYVEFILGSSTDPSVVARISDEVKGKKVFVSLDSSHRASHVLQELRAYGPLVSPGSYIVAEDTNLDGVPILPDYGPGPFAAVQEFLASNPPPPFERDLSREAFIMTWNRGGWLRRTH